MLVAFMLYLYNIRCRHQTPSLFLMNTLLLPLSFPPSLINLIIIHFHSHQGDITAFRFVSFLFMIIRMKRRFVNIYFFPSFLFFLFILFILYSFFAFASYLFHFLLSFLSFLYFFLLFVAWIMIRFPTLHSFHLKSYHEFFSYYPTLFCRSYKYTTQIKKLI